MRLTVCRTYQAKGAEVAPDDAEGEAGGGHTRKGQVCGTVDWNLKWAFCRNEKLDRDQSAPALEDKEPSPFLSHQNPSLTTKNKSDLNRILELFHFTQFRFVRWRMAAPLYSGKFFSLCKCALDSVTY
jgi:hypothetical protein